MPHYVNSYILGTRWCRNAAESYISLHEKITIWIHCAEKLPYSIDDFAQSHVKNSKILWNSVSTYSEISAGENLPKWSKSKFY